MKYYGLILYNILIYLLAPFILAAVLIRMIFAGKYRHSFLARAGWFRTGETIGATDPVIWLHAVSVGETLATIRFQKKLKESFPGYKLLFTATTETGYRIACEKCLSADAIHYFPLDYHFAIYPFLGRFNVKMLVLTETEVWPNLLSVLRRRGIPAAIINGRISDRSFGNYTRFSFLFRGAFALLGAALMQSETDASRITSIGALPDAVSVAGNLKYDEITPYLEVKPEEAFSRFMFDPSDAIFVAGSVHPGEDAMVVDAYLAARAELSSGGFSRPLRMIIAPRKFDRIEGLYSYLAEKGVAYEKRSELRDAGKACSAEVMVLDTVGELVRTYAMARAVFVGGSLVDVGGHNILEAAVFGKPVIFGPKMHNFREMSESFISSGAGFVVNDIAELAARVVYVMTCPENEYSKLSSLALSEVTSRSGATEKNILRLQTLLSSDKINSL